MTAHRQQSTARPASGVFTRRSSRAAILAMLLVTLCSISPASAAKIRFAVGPFQATPGDTRKAYEPFFRKIAQTLGTDYDLVVTTDWAGIATALANGQADIAWMGPWGYVLAHQEGGAQAIATVKYDDKPYYHAIIVGRPDLKIAKWPQDAKGMSISFADRGSTSGWLIPTHWFKMRGIDPKAFFKYREGAAHPANEIAVANGQVDLATDYDRNLRSMMERGLIKPGDVKIIWTSEPLPNDALVARAGLDPAIVRNVRDSALAIDEKEAKKLLPPHYTGWITADHKSYSLIEKAGVDLGIIKP